MTTTPDSAADREHNVGCDKQSDEAPQEAAAFVATDPAQSDAEQPQPREPSTPWTPPVEHSIDRDKCTNFSPPWFSGRWVDWHRSHGCDLDDGKPRSAEGAAEIEAARGRSRRAPRRW
jgi:hypothetical protein